MGDTDKRQEALKSDSCEDESEDESDVLEESPCGRWQKRREEVDQRDVPGIDYAFLAMDTEEGVEVVWNEVQFSEKRNFRAQQEQIRQVFDNLIQLDHPNIVKFHKYWTDSKRDKPRVIFITEYMSSGSLKQFLKKTKMNNKTFPLKVWKRWCTQILSALSYLHSCDPPIVHGNLTCDTILIQHNGLIKIGSVAPDAIHLHVKTCTENMRNMHCIAPEYENRGPVGTAVDIYSFGISALEIAAMGIQTNGGNHVTAETIKNTLASLDNDLQRDFIQRCIDPDPLRRPPARELLFHPILFEVHSLKLLSAHAFGKSDSTLPDSCTDETTKMNSDRVIAEIDFKGRDPVLFKYSQVQSLEMEKFIEDVRNGIFPLTAFALPTPPTARPRAITPELADQSVKSETPEPFDVETRLIRNMSCQVKHIEGVPVQMTLLLKMDEKMNRQLQCDIPQNETSMALAEELVHYGFINEGDKEKISKLIEDNLKPPMVNGTAPTVAVGGS